MGTPKLGRCQRFKASVHVAAQSRHVTLTFPKQPFCIKGLKLIIKTWCHFKSTEFWQAEKQDKAEKRWSRQTPAGQPNLFEFRPFLGTVVSFLHRVKTWLPALLGPLPATCFCWTVHLSGQVHSTGTSGFLIYMIHYTLLTTLTFSTVKHQAGWRRTDDARRNSGKGENVTKRKRQDFFNAVAFSKVINLPFLMVKWWQIM